MLSLSFAALVDKYSVRNCALYTLALPQSSPIQPPQQYWGRFGQNMLAHAANRSTTDKFWTNPTLYCFTFCIRLASRTLHTTSLLLSADKGSIRSNHLETMSRLLLDQPYSQATQSILAPNETWSIYRFAPRFPIPF